MVVVKTQMEEMPKSLVSWVTCFFLKCQANLERVAVVYSVAMFLSNQKLTESG